MIYGVYAIYRDRSRCRLAARLLGIRELTGLRLQQAAEDSAHVPNVEFVVKVAGGLSEAAHLAAGQSSKRLRRV